MSSSYRYAIKIALWLFVTVYVCFQAERRLEWVDACCYTGMGRLSGWSADDYAQLHRPGEPVLSEKAVVHKSSRSYSPVYYIAWEDDAQEDASSEPSLPKIQELATILSCLSGKLGVSSVAVSSPLAWEDAGGEMPKLMMDKAVRSFAHAGLGMGGRNAAQASGTPELLNGAVMPAAQVSGDISGLLSANAPLQYALPAGGDAPLLMAPDYVEDESLILSMPGARGMSMPLLLRWNGQVMVSLPLRMALAEMGLSPSDVHVRLGKSLRIGGKSFPLDAHGRIPLGAARALPLQVGEVLSAYMRLPSQGHVCAVLCRSFSPQRIESRARCMAATLSALLSVESEQLIPSRRPAGGHVYELNFFQRSLWGQGIALFMLLVLLAALPLLARRTRGIVLSVLLVCIIAAAFICAVYGIWLSLCAWVCGWLLLSLAVLLHSPQEKAHEPTLWE